MSSIYRKGRDGYYYYQTYIYNSETQKKDKRVFHALGTKDLENAKSKQKKLDLEYEGQSNNPRFAWIIKHSFSLKETIIIILTTIVLTNLVVNVYEKPIPPKQEYVVGNKSFSLENKASKTNPSNSNNKNQLSIIQLDSISKNDLVETGSKDIVLKIPNYKIERVDKLSNLFEQGKIHVTIDKDSTSEIQQRILCEEILNSHSEFSNVIICLYANNKAGKYLANGHDDSVSIEDKKNVWLAMYTYNSVEGAYFDNNPTGYLGIY